MAPVSATTATTNTNTHSAALHAPHLTTIVQWITPRPTPPPPNSNKLPLRPAQAKYTQEYDSFQDYGPYALAEYRRWLQAKTQDVNVINLRWGGWGRRQQRQVAGAQGRQCGTVCGTMP